MIDRRARALGSHGLAVSLAPVVGGDQSLLQAAERTLKDSSAISLEADFCSAPRWHDLVATRPTDPLAGGEQAAPEWSATFRLFEVGPQNFDATCRLLYDVKWLDNGIWPLVLSRFPLSPEQAAALPRSVSWRRFFERVGDELAALRLVLVAPLQTRSLPCVDFVDYVAALGCGGEVHVWLGMGKTVTQAITQAVGQSSDAASAFAKTAACCLTIRASRPVQSDELEQAILAIDGRLPKQALLVPSIQLGREGPNEIQVSLMTVLARQA